MQLYKQKSKNCYCPLGFMAVTVSVWERVLLGCETLTAFSFVCVFCDMLCLVHFRHLRSLYISGAGLSAKDSHRRETNTPPLRE